jgi:hypothetical protein
MTFKVAHIKSPTELVINAGSQDGIEEGQRFQVFAMGENISDPDTGESLGTLEIIKGIGRIAHVQERMSILQSDMKKPASKVVRRSSSSFFRAIGEGWTEEKIMPTEQSNFEEPELGDFVRPI